MIGSGLVVEVPGLVTGLMVRLVAGLLVGWLVWLFGFQLGLLGWLLLVGCVLLLALLLLVIWKVGSDPSIALGLFSSFCLWAMWNSCFSRSYLCLSSNAICSNLAFVSGSANAHRLLSSLAQSPTRIPGLRARTLPLSSLENHMKAGTFRFGAFGSFLALAPLHRPWCGCITYSCFSRANLLLS